VFYLKQTYDSVFLYTSWPISIPRCLSCYTITYVYMLDSSLANNMIAEEHEINLPEIPSLITELPFIFKISSPFIDRL